MDDSNKMKVFSGRRFFMFCMMTSMLSYVSMEAQVSNDDCSTAIAISGNTGDAFMCLNGTTKNALSDLM